MAETKYDSWQVNCRLNQIIKLQMKLTVKLRRKSLKENIEKIDRKLQS